MRRSGAPSQRSFSGLLNLPSPKTSADILSPKTPEEKLNLGGGSPKVLASETCMMQSGAYGTGSNAGRGMITSETTDSESSLTVLGQERHLLLSGPAQMSSPSTQPVHLRNPQSPNRSPLIQLNRPDAVLKQPSPANAKLLGQNPIQSPFMRSSICNNSPSEAKKPFSSNLTPAAAADSTTINSTSFRCLQNLLIFDYTLFLQVLCMCLG